MARNIIIFGVDLANSVNATNKTQNILMLGHGLTQKVNNTTIYAEIMVITVIYLLMVKKSLNFKPKNLKLKQNN